MAIEATRQQDNIRSDPVSLRLLLQTMTVAVINCSLWTTVRGIHFKSNDYHQCTAIFSRVYLPLALRPSKVYYRRINSDLGEALAVDWQEATGTQVLLVIIRRRRRQRRRQRWLNYYENDGIGSDVSPMERCVQSMMRSSLKWATEGRGPERRRSSRSRSRSRRE